MSTATAVLALVGGAAAATGDKPGKESTGEASAEKVALCHKQKVTIRVSKSAQPAHVAHGDTVGNACAGGAEAGAAAKEAKARAKAEKQNAGGRGKGEKGADD